MNKLIPLFVFIIACSQSVEKDRLPFYGNTIYGDKDTTYHTIQDFVLLDQDSSLITNQGLSNKIYVADFFFTSCPTICPVMKAQMLRVHEKFKENEQFIILSHTIDPEYDTIPLLKDYGERLGASADTWKFLWGSKEEIYDLAEGSYMSIADEDASAPGGFVHSGAFLLVDKKGRVRGVYDGTKEEQVDVLMKDIERLLAEYSPKKAS